MTDQSTRPQPSAEPVAEQVWREAYRARHDTLFCHESKAAAAVIASALEAARRETLEEAAKQVEQFERPRMDEGDYVFIREAAAAIRTLQENPNAG